jgi:hypothetical protein
MTATEEYARLNQSGLDVQIERNMADTPSTIDVTVYDKTAPEARPSDGMIASLWFSPDAVPVMAAALTAGAGRHLIEEPEVSEQGPIKVLWEEDATCVFLRFTERRIYDYTGGPATISRTRSPRLMTRWWRGVHRLIQSALDRQVQMSSGIKCYDDGFHAAVEWEEKD